MPNYVVSKNQEIGLLQSGQIWDLDTFNSLFETYRPRLLNYINRRVHNIDLAEELTQEAFLKAYLALPVIDENFNFSAWIFTIARNTCIDFWRYTKVRPATVSFDAELLAPEQKLVYCDDKFEANEVMGIIQEIINNLSARQKTAIALRDIEGYCYKEAAHMMNLSEAAFTSLLYRARINFVQEAIPVLYPRAKEIGFRYRECLTLLKAFSLSDWPDNPAKEITLKSLNYFERTAEVFDTNRTDDYPQDLDKYLLSKAPNTGNLVGADFGVGPGHLAVQMAGRFRQVKAIDIAPKMIECAKTRIKRKNICNISLAVGDIENLPYADESIDLGYCAVVLHHIFDPQKSIREMVRTIKPGGSLIIADLAEHQEDSLHKKMRDFWSGFNEKQFSAWLRSVGLEEVWIEKPKDCKFNFDIYGKRAKPDVIIAGGKKPLH